MKNMQTNVTKESLINQIIPKLNNSSVTKTTLLKIAKDLKINTSNILHTNNNITTRNAFKSKIRHLNPINLQEFNRRLNNPNIHFNNRKQQIEYGSP